MNLPLPFTYIKSINFGARVNFHNYLRNVTPEEEEKLTRDLSSYGSDNYRYFITTKNRKKGIALLEIMYNYGNKKDLKIGNTIEVRIGKNVDTFFRNLNNIIKTNFDFLSKQKHLY